MKEDFLLYFQLENAYTVNHFIHALHRIPVIKKIVEGKPYDQKGLKVLGSIYRVFKQIGTLILFKALYILGIVLFAGIIISERFPEEETYPNAAWFSCIFTIFIFGTLMGTLFNNRLFDTGEHSYYAVSLLRVDAGNYAFINYGYFLLKHLVFNVLTGLILFAIYRTSFLACILSAFFVLGAKLFFQGINLYFIGYFHKHGNVESWVKIGLTAAYFGAMMLVLFTEKDFSVPVINGVFITFSLLGIFGAFRILTFKDYAATYKKELSIVRNNVEVANQANKRKDANAAHNSLSEKTLSATSDKTGFAYLNDLFMKRHHKSLWGTVRLQLIIIALAIAVFALIFVLVPGSGEGFADFFVNWIPAIMFVMYCLNRGQNYTACLFVNCDHCFLTYPFFKEPKLILKLFTLRLISLIKLNILPGILLGAGFDLLYYMASGSSDALYYFVFFVSPVAMSVFFSIHYMMLYYLLQPYTIDAEIDSIPYKIISGATYVVSYMLLQMKIGSVYFGIGAILFCVIYSIVAVVLVYTKAAKTFKIKR